MWMSVVRRVRKSTEIWELELHPPYHPCALPPPASSVYKIVSTMSSKVVRMLLRSTDPSKINSESEEKTSYQKNPRYYESSSDTVSEKELIDMQVNKLLSLDQVGASTKTLTSRKHTSKRRKKDETPIDSSMILTNSRGSVMVAKRVPIPTFNKHRAEKEKKDAYFKMIAKKLQKEDKEKKKRKRNQRSLDQNE